MWPARLLPPPTGSRAYQMKRDLKGRRILITGASSGIGRCLAEQLVGEGARLVLAARSEEKLREVAGQLAGTPAPNGARLADVLVVPTDVTKPEERQRLLSQVVERFGGLDVLINNAGIASWAHFADSSEEILRQIMEVNFFAPAEMIRSAIPILEKGEQP